MRRNAIVLIYICYLNTLVNSTNNRLASRLLVTDKSMRSHLNIIKKFYTPRENWVTSNIGSYMFKHDYIFKYYGKRDTRIAQDLREKETVIKVLIWKHWLWLLDRHMQPDIDHEYSKIDPLYGCSVSNCIFSGKGDIDAYDVVVIHLQHGILPKVTKRNPNQLWIFWTDESPWNTFSLAEKPPGYQQFANIFNWSMTYRSDSDVPVPYGRTLPLQYPQANHLKDDVLKELVPYWGYKQNDVLATILSSNCVGRRANFVNKLKEHILIDIYGNCSTEAEKRTRCPGYFRSDCNITRNYYFYIVIENSNCRQYISEKSFHHGYSKGAIPVIIGSPVEDCNKLLPPNSFLHLDNFESPKHLALEIIAIGKDIKKLLSYHAWRNHFEVTNEHGYFETRSTALCRLCEALAYNERSRKVYSLDDIRLYLDPKICCSPRV